MMLAMHLEVQTKVVDELRAAFKSKDEEVDSENILKLNYLELVIKESMRLFPIAAIIGRKITSDLKLDGTCLKKEIFESKI